MKNTVEAKTRTTPSDLQLEVSSNDASASRPTSRVRADFEGLLELAEKLQQSYEKQASHRQSISIAGQVYSLFFAFDLLAAFVGIGFLLFNRISPSHSHPSHSTYLICIGSVITTVVLGLISLFYLSDLLQQLQQIKHRMKTDERDLTEVVELLREIEPVYAKEEQLSALERVQIRIRLSRFGIGSSSRGREDTARNLKEEFQSRKNRVDQELMKPF